MTALLDPFYPIVDSAAWIGQLLPAGVRLIQLRVKNLAVEKIRLELRAALALCAATGAQLIVNDHWRVALEERADFVHLGQDDLEAADLPAIRARGLRLGISTHDHRELDKALAVNPDYVALGPIYPTNLKAIPWAPQGLERIAEWKRLIGARPLVAIGGLTLERAQACLKAGADSVSVVTDILQSPDPVARTGAWIKATRIGA